MPIQKRALFGWLFLFIGLTPALTFFFWGNPQYFVWFSNHTFIILGLALLFRSPFWAFAELCLGLLPELTWSFDFIVNFLTGHSPMGITTYMFNNGSFNWLHLYSLQHVLFVPAALYAMYLLKGPVKKAWLGSIAHGIVMWGTSFAFSIEYNLNCVYHTCVFNIPYYRVTWPLLILAHVFLVYLLVFRIWRY